MKSLSNLSIKRGRQAGSHEDKKIATRTTNRDKDDESRQEIEEIRNQDKRDKRDKQFAR